MAAIDEVAYLMDEAFRGPGIEETNEAQSLLGNLSTVDDATWLATSPGAHRTIASIVLHVGTCKIMYDEYAFGEGRLRWDDASLVPWRDDVPPRGAAVEWLTSAHERLMAHVRALGDVDLSGPRLTNWGEPRETRWLLSTLLQHDAYHAGEINHIRALAASDDTWRWG